MSDMRIEEFIAVDPDICHGKPCFKGTRILVSIILELLEAGQSVEQIVSDYPPLTSSHIRAALHLASQVLSHERYIVFPAA